MRASSPARLGLAVRFSPRVHGPSRVEWAPPAVGANVSSSIAAGERFGADRHARDLMGESGGTTDRITAMDVYCEVAQTVDSQPTPPQRPADPFAGASRHQPPPPSAAVPPSSGSSPFASESRHQPADISPAGPSVAKAALQAAVAASSRSIDALVRARDQLQKQIDEERQNHATLVQLVEQAGRHGAA